MAETSSRLRQRKVELVSAGASHTVALLSGDFVCSWGRGEDGQLGHGDADERYSPTIISSLEDCEISYITCGADHTIARSDVRATVYSWGWGDFGRLGHGNSSDLFIPQPIKGLQGIEIKQIACGDSHCLAVTMDGEVKSSECSYRPIYVVNRFGEVRFAQWHRGCHGTDGLLVC